MGLARQIVDDYAPVVYAIAKNLESFSGGKRSAGDTAEWILAAANRVTEYGYSDCDAVAYSIVSTILDMSGSKPDFAPFRHSEELKQAPVELVAFGAFHKYLCSDLGCVAIDVDKLPGFWLCELEDAKTIERTDVSAEGFGTYTIQTDGGRACGWDSEYDDFYNIAQEA